MVATGQERTGTENPRVECRLFFPANSWVESPLLNLFLGSSHYPRSFRQFDWGFNYEVKFLSVVAAITAAPKFTG